MPPMDASERKRFIETLRQDEDFRAQVRRELLTDELLNLPQTVAVLMEHNAQMQCELTAVRGDVDTLVTTTRQLLEITQNLAGEMQQDFAAVRQDMTQARHQPGAAGLHRNRCAIRSGGAEIRDIKDPPAA